MNIRRLKISGGTDAEGRYGVFKILEMLRQNQLSGAVALRVKKNGKTGGAGHGLSQAGASDHGARRRGDLGADDTHPLFSEKPGDDFAAVPYRDRWFWIDERDYQSKKLFSFLMFAMTLTETGGKEGAPIVTISAGG